MGIVSYAQNFEDVMLWRALKDVKNGFYIDIGANDPIVYSVTKAFYDQGWRGINCEPVSYWYEKLQEHRIKDLNLQVAIGSDNEKLEFYEVVNTGLSTLSKKIAQKHADKLGFEVKNYFVYSKTLTAICKEENIDVIHFLKIDVEGAEKQVLEGIDFDKIRPWIIVIEATEAMTQNVNYNKWEYLITSKKYHFVYFDGLNRFYIADEHSELDFHFETPPNIFDDFILVKQRDSLIRADEAEIRANKAEVEVNKLLIRADEAEIKAISRLNKAEDRANEAWHNFNTIENSKSWKMTKPLRVSVQYVKKLIQFLKGNI